MKEITDVNLRRRRTGNGLPYDAVNQVTAIGRQLTDTSRPDQQEQQIKEQGLVEEEVRCPEERLYETHEQLLISQ